ncbi:excitatory amino acid transporter 2 [Stachybotrys elegans]|uniref:Amino acid transporter n=1 Tax=Stachybotrys elegans TaxID=80388 RepID=A0A8K0WP45_9HYPO|nr:excitatory amino acid transporter 2 [Stachybotrys elegans]
MEKQVNLDQQTSSASSEVRVDAETESVKKTFWQRQREPGSPLPIIAAALLAIAIGLAVSTQTEVPQAAFDILNIPGRLWLRALQATVLPLIMTAMILAIQNIKEISGGKGRNLAIWSVGWYVLTTFVAIAHSCLLTGLVWAPLMENNSDSTEPEEEPRTVSQAIVTIFDSFVPSNIIGAVANNELLSVLVTTVIFAILLPPTSSIMKVVRDIDTIITKVITFLIQLAPIGVFFLIMSNLFRLDIASIGYNLGILIGGTLTGMAIHLFIVFPLLYLIFARQNAYTHLLKCSPAWLTAWGSASSAATMPVTLRCIRARGVPETVVKFAIPLGTLINMDGTAIYFPMVVVFMAETQGITLDGGQYVIICLLSVLSSIATTPIPSSSLVLTLMIANAVNIPQSEMYAVVVAIDWFLDRFRTMVNVSGDLIAAPSIARMCKITQEDDLMVDEAHALHAPGADNTTRV